MSVYRPKFSFDFFLIFGCSLSSSDSYSSIGKGLLLKRWDSEGLSMPGQATW